MIIGKEVEVTEPIYKGYQISNWKVYRGIVLDKFTGYIVEQGEKIKADLYLIELTDGKEPGLCTVCRRENVNKIINNKQLEQ